MIWGSFFFSLVVAVLWEHMLVLQVLLNSAVFLYRNYFNFLYFPVWLLWVTVSNSPKHYLGLLSLCKVLGDTLYAGCFIKSNLFALYYTADLFAFVNLTLGKSILPSFLCPCSPIVVIQMLLGWETLLLHNYCKWRSDILTLCYFPSEHGCAIL